MNRQRITLWATVAAVLLVWFACWFLTSAQADDALESVRFTNRQQRTAQIEKRIHEVCGWACTRQML